MTEKNIKEIIKADLYRYNGQSSFKNSYFAPLEIKYMIIFRKLSALYAKKQFGLSYRILRYRLRHLEIVTQIQIPIGTSIGAGFYIGHTGRIIINSATVIGENCNIATGVTIGATNRGSKKGSPTIGNNVWIGTNAVIVGNISIGDDVLIAPLSYVNIDVPSHSIVIGNPARIIPCNNATEDYIMYCSN